MNKIELIQKRLQEAKISAVVIPTTDDHGSEYIAEHWQILKYFSGFTGSAGTLVVTEKTAALWTDSRYFLQAEQQLRDTSISLMKEGLPQTPTFIEWLLSEIEEGSKILIDPKLFSINNFKKIENDFFSKNISITTEIDIVYNIWDRRPAIPNNHIFEFKKSGKSVEDKIKWFQATLQTLDIDAFVLTSLDEIAWLFNIRGNDIRFNPLTISYAYISAKKAIFFVDNKKINSDLKTYFIKNNIEIVQYECFFDFLHNVKDKTIGVDFQRANYQVFKSLNRDVIIKDIPSPLILAKSIKNNSELIGFKKAMIRDGVALVRFFMWLERAVAEGVATEMSATEMLHRFRAEQRDFISESFETITAYQAHGAIVHYTPTSESNIKIEQQGLLLLDSGGQYLCGTTDITRTVSLGKLSKEQKRDFTLVLKGHIALAKARFPKGTRGTQLDVLARQYLWQNLKNYGHGTGHGVGHCLCVHEGPQSIRMQENPQILLEGMITSNEPAFYNAGKYGIRHENLIVVKELKEKNIVSNFLCFETITLFPFDTKALDLAILTQEEIEWINTYHSKCYKKLSPSLSRAEIIWLKKATKRIYF